jgi:GT2 family glycosyltransferase
MRLLPETVSVVIATIGRAELVEECLRSMVAVGTPSGVEVVVVDAGGAGWVSEVKLKAIWPNTRVVISVVRNAGVQRNIGVKQASGEIMIFLDDDCIIQLGWWPAIVEPLCESGNDGSAIAAVAGAIWRNPSPRFTDARGGYVNLFGYPIQVTHRSEKAQREVDWPISCNMSCLKKAYIEVGGMADIYGVYDEDVDLGLKWRNRGWRIVFEPRAAVYHYSVSQQRKVITKATEFRAGRNRAILLVRNYGLSLRLLLFLSGVPFVKIWQILRELYKQAVKSMAHAGAYAFGVLRGLYEGVRNPVKQDRERFDLQG